MPTQPKRKEPVRSNTSSSLLAPAMLEIDVTEGLRTFVLDDDDDDDTTPQPGSPMIVVTPPLEGLSARQRLRQLSSDVVPVRPRPKLKRKAATAPPGTLQLYSHLKPQVPRRAISERTERPGQIRGNQYRQSSTMIPQMPRLPLRNTPATRPIISRRMTSRKSVGKLALKPKMQVWRLSPRSSTQHQLMSEALSDRIKRPVERSSFSEKARVKDTLERKQLDSLRTPFVDFKSKDLPGTPGSMLATPQELYGGPSSNGPSARTRLGGSRLGTDRPMTAESPMSPITASRAKHFSLPLTPHVQCRTSFRRSSSEARAKNGPTRNNVYIPGPIQLEEKTAATPRRGSIATMEPFDETEPKSKRFSDMVALDSIVYFFQGLSVVAESSEECLDRYWVPNQRASRRVTSVQNTVPPLPGPRTNSFFSTHMARQHDERRLPPSPETPGRRRLRSLLKSSRSLL
ncbi:hypothetical protein P280DRAFT_157173 [Massarina eburnea CBS 473.64]|uniref:Uncharacterized protein n=1 Tax=Massarina eburnea CBS 473.64 TaxID=1395130 RepID=A0A6A6RLQ6_9PLEO|nr:hypothetical protein P280DRAFT_157173 [Massarina eburnea CBS 473.64]